MKSEGDRVSPGVRNGRARQSWGKGNGEASSISPLLLQGWQRAPVRSGWSPASPSSVLGRTFPAQCPACPQLMSRPGCSAGSRSPCPASHHSPARCHRSPGTSPSALPPARTMENHQLRVRMFHPQPSLLERGVNNYPGHFPDTVGIQQTPPGPSTHLS